MKVFLQPGWEPSAAERRRILRVRNRLLNLRKRQHRIADINADLKELISSDRSFLIRTGAAVTAAFVVLRATNLYGEPAARSMQVSVLGTLLSFVDCEKYPLR